MGDGEVSKSILQTDVFPILKKHVQLVLIVPPHRVRYYRDQLGPDITVVVMSKPRSARKDEAWSDVFLYGVPTESIRVKIEHSYLSGGSLFGKWIKLLLWQLGAWYPYRAFLRRLYMIDPDNSLDDLFAAHPPDLVFAANLTSMDDARLLKAARKRGIRTVGMPKGWDNLTLKTFLPVFPDHLMVQTRLMREDAERLDYPSNRISVVGFPKFDVYHESSLLVPREDFMRKFDFDPKRPLILYAGAGNQLAPYDEEILADFLEAIEKGTIDTSPQVLVRPHPKYVYHAEKIPERPFWALDRPGSLVGNTSDFEFSKDDVVHLMNSLYHANVLIHTASTLGVEAAIFDTPTITIAYDGHAKLPEGLSVARYYRYDHLRRVLATEGTRVVHSFNELVEAVSAALNDPSAGKSGRERLVAENAHIVDGEAGTRVAEVILSQLK